MNIKIQTPKGFRDFLPPLARKRLYVKNTLRKIFESFGFEPLETPALEYSDILMGKYGEEGEKLMYSFETKGGDKLTMRYDQTVPLARVVAEYKNSLPMPFKRYQIQPVWRGENPQKGRFREFLQCDIDTIGISSHLADAEIIAATAKSLDALGFKNYKILINDRNIFSNLLKRQDFDEKMLQTVIRSMDKIKKIGREAVLNEMVDKGIPADQADYAIQTIEYMQPTENLQKIFDLLGKLGVDNNKFIFSPILARGLDYYTGMIFEVEIEGYEAGSVAGGGRYDNLIGIFSGTNIPAVGMAFGFDRLIEAMETLDLFPENLFPTQVLVTIFSKELESKALEACEMLRSNNINTEIWLDPENKLDKQLKYADQKKIPFAVIIGPDEAKKGLVTLKDLINKTQEVIPLDEVVRKLTS